MARISLCSLLVSLLSFTYVQAQLTVQWTVTVTSANTFEIYFIPDMTVSGINNMSASLAFDIPTSYGSTAGDWGVNFNPQYHANPGTQLEKASTMDAPGRTAVRVNPLQSNANNESFTAGTPYLLATITIPPGVAMSDVRLVHYPGGFMDGMFPPIYQMEQGIGTFGDVTNGGMMFVDTPGSTGTPVNCGNQCCCYSYLPLMDFNPLPIELTAFETRTADCDVSLYWETATEQDFGYYQIEASRDGRRFSAIGQQKPESPNSVETRRYKYAVPAEYHNFYFRLKAVDLDGSFEYSPLVFAKAPCAQEKYSMNLYPNPNFTSELMVEVNSPRLEENVQLHLTDAFGKVIRIQDANLEVGRNTIRMETEGLPSGTYYVRVIGVEQLSEPLKFIRNNF